MVYLSFFVFQFSCFVNIFFHNSLPNGKILDSPKLKALAAEELNVAQMINSVIQG